MQKLSLFDSWVRGIMAHVFGSRTAICQYKGLGGGESLHTNCKGTWRLVILNTRKSFGWMECTEQLPFPRGQHLSLLLYIYSLEKPPLFGIMLDKLTIQSNTKGYVVVFQVVQPLSQSYNSRRSTRRVLPFRFAKVIVF